MAREKGKTTPLERTLRDLSSRWRSQRTAHPQPRSALTLSEAKGNGLVEGRPAQKAAPLHLGPATAFDVLLQERINALERGLDEVKGRVNGLIFLVVGAVVAQVVLGLVK